jgi:hypothetical protein
MVDLIDDQGVWPNLLALRDCLCEEIAKSGLPEVCYCDVMPGALAPFDFADDGQAWVRLVNAFPSLIFPNQSTDLRASCAAPLAYVIEVGIVRCAPRYDGAGHPPSQAEEFEATRIQMADMAAMRRAIQCCLNRKDAVLGIYTPIGPDEGGIGGTWQVTIP